MFPKARLFVIPLTKLVLHCHRHLVDFLELSPRHWVMWVQAVSSRCQGSLNPASWLWAWPVVNSSLCAQIYIMKESHVGSVF